MQAYLIRRQLLNALGLGAFLIAMPFVAGYGSPETVPDALLLAGLVSAPYTWWDLRRSDLWPLFDNFRVPRVRTLLVGSSIPVMLSLVIRFVA